ncbi:molybdopterin-dependent oxidoreductase, partial [Micromonospora sp. AMSO31t]|uniref:molybdopterin-dependent oxidoreductase n=1 Tax=Micromonospora sp. AMSO31t TaxID=2650566 RepID=UPI001CEDEA0D
MSHAEADHDTRRSRQWLAGEARGAGVDRDRLLELGAAMAALTAAAAEREPVALASAPVGVDPGTPIAKPLPPELLRPLDTNAEMHWTALAGQGYVVPNDRFFVRNHTETPRLDAGTWRLRLFGTGLRDAPTRDAPVEFSLDELRRLPAEESDALLECAGNGRRFFTEQQGEPAPGV